MTYRVISETLGLVWTGTDPDEAEQAAIKAAVNTGRTVYLQEGTENTPLPMWWSMNPG